MRQQKETGYNFEEVCLLGSNVYCISVPGRGAAKLEKLNVSSVLVQCSSAQSVPRVWVKIEIKTNIMARSVLPDTYLLFNYPGLGCSVFGHFNQSGGVITAINIFDFEFYPNSWKNLLVPWPLSC
jgi:hypothetical protein